MITTDNINLVIKKDGNKWCALEGVDLQAGVAGFGSSPYGAVVDFLKNRAIMSMVGYDNYISHCSFNGCPGIFNDIREDGFYCNDCGKSLNALIYELKEENDKLKKGGE